MADITMCTNKDCNIRETCKRVINIPNGQYGLWQSYQLFIPDGKDETTREDLCKFYIPIYREDSDKN